LGLDASDKVFLVLFHHHCFSPVLEITTPLYRVKERKFPGELNLSTYPGKIALRNPKVRHPGSLEHSGVAHAEKSKEVSLNFL
jgi:hypothetical protein